MPHLPWTTDHTIEYKGQRIACAPDLHIQVDRGTGLGQQAGVRPDTPGRLRLKRLAAPLFRLQLHTLGTGFLMRGVGRWIRRYADADTNFLDVGCGAMSLRHYMPAGCVYNAIEMALSEYVITCVVKDNPNINVAFALATDIPLEDNAVDVVASTEVFEHIPPIDEAINEIHRIMRPGGKLLCSIPNNYYHKYQVVGENPDHINKWTFDEFVEFMKTHRFNLIERQRIGYWIPLKHKRLRNLYLPITPRDEYYTSNFLYAFEVDK